MQLRLIGVLLGQLPPAQRAELQTVPEAARRDRVIAAAWNARVRLAQDPSLAQMSIARILESSRLMPRARVWFAEQLALAEVTASEVPAGVVTLGSSLDPATVAALRAPLVVQKQKIENLVPQLRWSVLRQLLEVRANAGKTFFELAEESVLAVEATFGIQVQRDYSVLQQRVLNPLLTFLHEGQRVSLINGVTGVGKIRLNLRYRTLAEQLVRQYERTQLGINFEPLRLDAQITQIALLMQSFPGFTFDECFIADSESNSGNVASVVQALRDGLAQRLVDNAITIKAMQGKSSTYKVRAIKPEGFRQRVIFGPDIFNQDQGFRFYGLLLRDDKTQDTYLNKTLSERLRKRMGEQRRPAKDLYAL